VPATRSDISACLATTDRAAGEIIGSLDHLGRRITVAQAAANAIMAGCRPEYFPVVLAAWQAVNLERSVRGAWQSTSGPAPLIIVNGPVRSRLGINCTGGVFGPGFRANATIARAIGLIVRNGYGIRDIPILVAGAANAAMSMVFRPFGWSPWSGRSVPVAWAAGSAGRGEG
jgi:hypothetical protein